MPKKSVHSIRLAACDGEACHSQAARGTVVDHYPGSKDVASWTLFPALVGVALFAGGLGLTGFWRRRGPRDREHALEPRLLVTPPLQGEQLSLHRNLCAALPGFHVFPQVALDRLLDVRGNDRASCERLRQAMAGHSVDFVVCDADMAVLAVVEVEDVVRGDRGIQQRAQWLRRAGMPLLSWDTARMPTLEELHDALHELITLRQLSYGWRRTDATEQESRQPEPPRARKTAILRRHSGP